ncbi:hypothetical protein FAVG1_01064 [Fusarium avenaceum]|nr:hypothetical protein FAVG1_01064 [Fusarium avenaceum]
MSIAANTPRRSPQTGLDGYDKMQPSNDAMIAMLEDYTHIDLPGSLNVPVRSRDKAVTDQNLGLWLISTERSLVQVFTNIDIEIKTKKANTKV